MKLFLKQLLLLLCASLTMIPVKSFANFEFNDAEVNAVIMQSVFQQRIPKSHLKYAGSEWVLFHRVYKLRFEDGTIVEFDIEGDWLYVSSDDEDLVTDFVPCPILGLVKHQYVCDHILKLEHDAVSYTVWLSSGKELNFNENYELIDEVQI